MENNFLGKWYPIWGKIFIFQNDQNCSTKTLWNGGIEGRKKRGKERLEQLKTGMELVMKFQASQSGSRTGPAYRTSHCLTSLHITGILGLEESSKRWKQEKAISLPIRRQLIWRVFLMIWLQCDPSKSWRGASRQSQSTVGRKASECRACTTNT